MYLGKDTSLSSIYAEYVFEENLNIKTDAVGANNGTFLALGDIDGDSDQELIVGSNRTVSGDEDLLAIYDYVSGELTRIWASWTTSHQTKMILPTGIATFDFDAFDGDEIYICSEDAKILRFTNWSTNDFGESKYVYNHEDNFPGRKLMGYLSIGDPNNDLIPEIVVGDDSGDLHILTYNSGTDDFSIVNPLTDTHTPDKIFGINTVTRIHAVEVADIGDIDTGIVQEILYLAQ